MELWLSLCWKERVSVCLCQRQKKENNFIKAEIIVPQTLWVIVPVNRNGNFILFYSYQFQIHFSSGADIKPSMRGDAFFRSIDGYMQMWLTTKSKVN